MGIGVRPYGTDYSGPTSKRPAKAPLGEIYYDTTTGQLVVKGNSGWQLPFSEANLTAVAAVAGDTASRPATPAAGYLYFDTDLGELIVHNGSAWVHADGTAIV